jgi:hypothetical protein
MGQALRKARFDGAVGVLVAPLRITAPWWPILVSASRTPGSSRVSAPYIRLKSSRALRNPSGTHLGSVAVCIFDFRSDRCKQLPSQCPGSRVWRGPSCVAASDDRGDEALCPLPL